MHYIASSGLLRPAGTVQHGGGIAGAGAGDNLDAPTVCLQSAHDFDSLFAKCT